MSALVAPAHAQVDAPRVVLDADDPAIVAAVRASLEPWGVEVREGRRARGDDVRVWTRPDGEGTQVRVEAASIGRPLERRVPVGPPYDAASAAAVALSVKTLLRNTPVAPVEERLAAPPTPPPRGRVTLGLGARLAAFDPPGAEARADLGALWHLAFGRRLGLGLEIGLGWPLRVEDGALDARLTTVDLGALFDLRGEVVPTLELGGALVVGGRLGVLDGTVEGPGGGGVRVVRLDPLVRARAELTWRAGARLAIGLRLGVAAPLRRQDYRVRGESVLVERPLAFEGGLVGAVLVR